MLKEQERSWWKRWSVKTGGEGKNEERTGYPFWPDVTFSFFFFPSEGKPVSFPRVGGGWAARNDLMNGISSTPLLSNHSGHLPLTPFTFPTSASSSSPSPVLFYLLLLRFPHQFERDSMEFFIFFPSTVPNGNDKSDWFRNDLFFGFWVIDTRRQCWTWSESWRGTVSSRGGGGKFVLVQGRGNKDTRVSGGRRREKAIPFPPPSPPPHPTMRPGRRTATMLHAPATLVN